MTVKVQMVNGGSDSVDFVNAAGTTLAKVKGYDDGSSNGHLEFYTTASGTSTEKMRITSAGNVGIGTSSPACKLELATTNQSLKITGSGAANWMTIANTTRSYNFGVDAFGLNVYDNTAGAYRMVIDSSGNLLVGKAALSNTTNGGTIAPSGEIQSTITNAGGGNQCLFLNRQDATGTAVLFRQANNSVGSISVTASATAYNTSSDYRLKENIAPMTGALSVVQTLKPCTYTWKADGSDGQGFIAHELQSVVPDCVTGEKDAVDENGNPIYQGIDTSFLVATLTAAIQEQQAIINAQDSALKQLTERITALENKQ